MNCRTRRSSSSAVPASSAAEAAISCVDADVSCVEADTSCVDAHDCSATAATSLVALAMPLICSLTACIDSLIRLAEESQAAAANIAALVTEIQAETQRTVDVVDDGATRTEAGTAVVRG